MQREINNYSCQEKQSEIQEIQLENVLEIEVESYERVSSQEWKDSKEDTKYW